MSSEETKFSLLINDVKREDAGSYSCEISNKWGSDQCDGQLLVKCPPRFEQELHDIYAKESDVNIEFTVKLNSYPKATVTWWVNFSKINSRLQFENVTTV